MALLVLRGNIGYRRVIDKQLLNSVVAIIFRVGTHKYDLFTSEYNYVLRYVYK